MVMVLDSVVPFGRSLDEYVKIFSLSQTDLAGKLIGIGDGPASFNAEGTQLGYAITSVDPVYIFSGAEIKTRFDQVVDPIVNQIRATPNDWVWDYHQSPERLKDNRVAVIHRFLEDYAIGKQAGRYVVGELPTLAFAEQEFSLALCSHLLFLYSDHFDYEFHLASIQEMLRVAAEVRIFPLLTLNLQRSPYLDKIMAGLRQQGFHPTVQRVDYELQRGGNEMLVIRR
jgi:hypothetical protein